MMEKRKIESRNEIKILVDFFYAAVREDEILGPVFEEKIGDLWPEHLEKMYRFWQTVLLAEHTYFGSPFPPHARLPIGKAHFERWLELFRATLKTHFTGTKAQEAMWRAEKMAEVFSSKIGHLSNQ